MDYPAINERVRKLVDKYANGSVRKFSKLIGLSSSQKLNRLFHLDQRNNKFPEPSLDIITSITNKFTELNTNWLLTGEGDMYQNSDSINIHLTDHGVSTKGDGSSIYNKNRDVNVSEGAIELLKKEIASLEKQLAEKDRTIAMMQKVIDMLENAKNP